MLHGSHNLGYQLWFCIWLITKTCRVLLHLSRCYRIFISTTLMLSLHWRHNDHDGVSNHKPPSCLLNRLFRPRSKKTSKLRVTGLCVGNSPGPVNSPHKGPVTRKMFPFDDVIMSNPKINVIASWITYDGRFPAISSSTPRKGCTPG